MGCDIHAYVEFVSNNTPEYVSCAATDINVGGNYLLFALMACVRGEFPESMAPKGVPTNLGWQVLDEFTLQVSDAEWASGMPGYCTLKRAKEHVSRRCSKWVKENERITHPDWHSASWLTADEMAEIANAYVKHCHSEALGFIDVFKATIAFMRVLDRSKNGKARLVFCFDN